MPRPHPVTSSGSSRNRLEGLVLDIHLKKKTKFENCNVKEGTNFKSNVPKNCKPCHVKICLLLTNTLLVPGVDKLSVEATVERFVAGSLQKLSGVITNELTQSSGRHLSADVNKLTGARVLTLNNAVAQDGHWAGGSGSHWGLDRGWGDEGRGSESW